MENFILTALAIGGAYFLDWILKKANGNKKGHDTPHRVPETVSAPDVRAVATPVAKPKETARVPLPHEGVRVTADMEADPAEETPPMVAEDPAEAEARAAHFARWRQAMVDSWLLERKF